VGWLPKDGEFSTSRRLLRAPHTRTATDRQVLFTSLVWGILALPTAERHSLEGVVLLKENPSPLPLVRGPGGPES
jgi:hypothetical protein